ncbi:GAF domain-containing protein [uncultured Thermanaerothrix sp.]|uniref:GAF domain-containing protein n=1 Tax=uncultured Thermanaerothrix sp. TaxID=1195149 RepID=UPI0026392B9C|nr:GAF domain-containing protein [uncultured Thermanaerothrix sp.]
MVEPDTQTTPVLFAGIRAQRGSRVLLLLWLILLSIITISLSFTSSAWLVRPSLGVLVLPGMRVGALLNPIEVTDHPGAAQLKVGDHILRVDGRAVPNGSALLASLEGKKVGEEVFLSVESADGDYATRIQGLQPWPRHWQARLNDAPLALGLTILTLAWLAFLRLPDHPANRALTLLGASLGFVLAGSTDLWQTHRLTPMWTLAFTLTLAALLDFVTGVSEAVLPPPWSNRLRWGGYALALGTAGVINGFLLSNSAQAPFLAWRVLLLLLGVYGLAGLTLLTLAARQAETAPQRNRALGLLAATLLTFPALYLWAASLLLGLGQLGSATPVLAGLTLALPITGGLNQSRSLIISPNRLLWQAALYALVGIGYGLLVAGGMMILNALNLASRPIVTGAFFALVALSLLPLYRRIEKSLDTLFLPGERALQERLNHFIRDLTHAVELPQILNILRTTIQETLQPTLLHIFLYDPLGDQYVATPDLGGQPTSDLRFSTHSALVHTLHQQAGPLYISNPARLSNTLYGEQARLTLLGAHIYYPLKTRNHLSGWIALGPPAAGSTYTTRDYTFLSALADQASLAIERAQVIANLNQRMHQMNVLIRVAQGVNVTLAVEDIYELIYAQTAQVIPSETFQLLLHETTSDALRVVFEVWRDERLSERENRLIPLSGSLEGIILRQRKPILTEDYTRECRARGILGPQADLYAWVGVPLNTGAETIGVLCLGSQRPEVHYTQEQVNLLQAIADQVAGAIAKARLLNEAERRARQLKTLNEVTQKLSSTLELEPLLHTILENAVGILACEAGSLLLWDEASDELVFRVVLGPVAQNLLNQRMPSDRGLAGKTFQTRQPQIVNDVNASPEWFRLPDEMTGFVTRAVLAVPLVVKERTIGVLEVVNRKDGSNFTAEDAELLSAFAAQAAIAIENARLYTLTDQALAARVEELSVMQRIDRELNATLDLSQAMAITLNWAMRRSHASVGLIGPVDETGLRPIAWQGIEAESLPTPEAVQAGLPLTTVLASGKTLRRALDDTAMRLHPESRVQVFLPIRREEGVSTLLILESADPDFSPPDVLEFLQRLCDHAAIALANAQLYAAVRAANLAKSEFVSFVAHELKNPMTSIKGYTELLIAGAVGPVSEAQASFLNVIRSNVDRMSTLVSDLNDLSKIEAGRMRLEFAALNLADIVGEVERSTRRQIEDKQQTFTLHLPSNLPPVWADRTRLIQILVNLVNNAHKYTDPGGQIILGAERSPNHWDPNGAREVVHIWVQDTGIGIAPADQPKIFQKFFRSEDPKTREVPGSGLGLNITRSLVEMQGGKIWFESEYRKGTTFHFTVPIAEIAPS